MVYGAHFLIFELLELTENTCSLRAKNKFDFQMSAIIKCYQLFAIPYLCNYIMLIDDVEYSVHDYFSLHSCNTNGA